MIDKLFGLAPVDQVEDLKDRLLSKEFDNALLRAEVATLARKLREKSYEGRLLSQADADARLLTLLHVAGSPTSRSAIVPDVMNRGRWRRAIALLTLARVHTGYRFTTKESQQIADAVKKAVERCERDGIESLRLRIPKRGAY